MIVFNALAIAFIVYFIKVTSWKGHIFEKQGTWLEQNLPEKLYKPLIGCPVCMTPYWGTIIYSVAHFLSVPGFEIYSWPVVIMTIFVAAGINSVILMFNKLYDAAKDEEKVAEKELRKTKSK
jgi:amino acid transporter